MFDAYKRFFHFAGKQKGTWYKMCIRDSAWAMGPELFVLDEPSSKLDGEGIRQLREILKQLKKAGKTVLMAEHRLWYAADLADRVFYLRGGQLQREYSGQNFLTLTEKERRSLGLRLSLIHICAGSRPLGGRYAEQCGLSHGLHAAHSADQAYHCHFHRSL